MNAQGVEQLPAGLHSVPGSRALKEGPDSAAEAVPAARSKRKYQLSLCLG